MLRGGAVLLADSGNRRHHGVEAMAHLTCVGSTRDMLSGVLDEILSLGIENVLCLRGDPPKGETTFKPVEGGFRYAVDLIHFVKKIGGFGIGAACYPEGHVECGDKQLDWDRAAAKVEASVKAEKFEDAMAALAPLRPVVDAFFDKVMVNAPDQTLRTNRLKLLSRLRATLHLVADFSRIEG